MKFFRPPKTLTARVIASLQTGFSKFISGRLQPHKLMVGFQRHAQNETKTLRQYPMLKVFRQSFEERGEHQELKCEFASL